MDGCHTSIQLAYISLPPSRRSPSKRSAGGGGGGVSAAVMKRAGADVQVYSEQENLYTLIGKRSE